MSMQPEHPLRPAFEKAIEWAREQEKLLNTRQREVFEALKHRQAKEREIRQKWLDGVRKELREREKNQKPKPELALKPPVLVNDPQTRRLARLAIANEKRLERLDARHQARRSRCCRSSSRSAPRRTRTILAARGSRPCGKAAEQEKDRSREKERERDPLDRSR